MKKTLCALTMALAGLIGCSQKPTDLNEVALRGYQEARKKFSDKEWKTTWSADGKRKTVSYQDEDYVYGFVMNADETECENLSNLVSVTRLSTINPAWDGYPSWSPDGTQLIFHSYRDGQYEIYKMNADGTGVTRLTNNPDKR